MRRATPKRYEVRGTQWVALQIGGVTTSPTKAETPPTYRKQPGSENSVGESEFNFDRIYVSIFPGKVTRNVEYSQELEVVLSIIGVRISLKIPGG